MRNKLILAALTTAGSLALATSSHSALLAWYTFDGNGNDFSTNAPAAALNGPATFAGGPAPAVSGNLSSLDLGTVGNGASATVPAGTHWDSAFINNAMAVSFWQLNTQIGNSSAFWVHSPAAGSNDRGFQAHTPWSNGTVFFDQSGCCAGGQRLTVGGAVTVNQWQHFVFQRDAAGNREIWVDGALAANAGGAEALDAFNGLLTIGAEGNSNNNSFGGSLDEFALWDDVLTASEIADLAGGARIPEPSGTLLSLLGVTLLAVRRRRK